MLTQKSAKADANQFSQDRFKPVLSREPTLKSGGFFVFWVSLPRIFADWHRF